MIVCIIKCPKGVSIAESGAIFHSRGESPYDPPRYKVIDEQLFFLAVLKYGIEFEEMKWLKKDDF
jgi:hypothetical protein